MVAGAIAGFIGMTGLGLPAIDAARAETLNWVTYKPQGAGDPQAVTTQWFANELDRRTGGKHKIRIHWGGSVAGINEIPTALENGVGDLGDVVTPYFPDQLLINNAISYFWPQPNSSIELGLLMQVWNQTYPQFSQELSKYKLKLIGLRPLEAYGMICNKPVRSVEDFKGLRVRSYGFALPALIKALGGVPVSMGTPETYEALERKIIDCSPVGPTLAAGWKYDEIAKYYIELPLGASWGHLIAMNIDKFNKLPKELQVELESIGREYLIQYCTEMQKAENAVRKKWKDSGKVEVLSFPLDQFSAVVSKDPGIKAVQNEWVKRAKAAGLPTDDIVKALSF
jgi:TRAP-type C4-dicarboxylate transport system substrate-binding protein